MLTIAACATHSALLEEQPGDLRARLRAETGLAVRRTSRFIELGLLGAQACRRAAAGGIAADTALYLCSEAGTLGDSARVLAELIGARRPPSPVDFINVSSNLAGYYIAQHLGLAAPQLVVHREQASFEAALELLLGGAEPGARALVGFVEEGAWPLAEHRQRLEWNGPIAECSHWLYVDAAAPRPLGHIEQLERHADADALLRALDGIEARGHALALAGGWGAAQLAHIDRRLAPAARLPALDAKVWSGGRSAQALAEFLLRPIAPRLLLLSRAECGECYLVRARAA